MEELRITLIQTVLHWEDVQANLTMFSEKISSLKEETDIIILPEMFSTGFSMNAEKVAETMDGLSLKWMKETARMKNCVVTGSLMIREESGSGSSSKQQSATATATSFFNRLIWMQPDGNFFQYDKRHLFRLAGEEKTYTRGTKKIIVEHKGWKICPLVCYDLRFPVWSRRTKKEDYDLLIYTANWPERRVQAWNQLLIARAIENQCYVAGVNRVGNDGHDIYHSGESVVVNYLGEIVNSSCPHDSCNETVTIKKSELLEFRKNFPFIDDADEFRMEV